MSQSSEESEENKQGFSIDEHTYYKSNAALNGWVIHTCWPPAAELMPLIGKRITDVLPASFDNGKKRRAKDSESLALPLVADDRGSVNATHQPLAAKRLRTSRLQELNVVQPNGQVRQHTHALPESCIKSPLQQRSQAGIDKLQRTPMPTTDATQHMSRPVASIQTHQSQASQSRRRVLPERGVITQESVRIRNFKPTSTSTAASTSTSTHHQKNAATKRIHRAQTPSEEAPLKSVVYDAGLFDNLSKEQKKIHNYIVHKHESVFFTGSAGTGKSVLLKTLINSLQHIHGRDTVAITASTGIAACNIGGVTLHSELAIGRGDKEPSAYIGMIRNSERVLQKINRLKVLVIDEISMIDGLLFDKIDQVLRTVRLNQSKPFGGVQLVLCGDFYQLPPISRSNQTLQYTFQAQCWDRAISKCLELKTVFRQSDQHFASMLNELRIGKVSSTTERELQGLRRALPIINHIEPTQLYPLRRELDKANTERLDALPGESHTYLSIDTGNMYLYKHCIAPEAITLKVDAQVMLVKNLTPTLVNGSRGVVVRFSNVNGEMFPVVRFSNNSERVITRDNFTFESQGVQKAQRIQIPLVLAWALSIHKSQGQTIEYLKVDLRSVFDYGQAYVALSRATSMDNLQVLNFSRDIVKTHPKVAEFYRKHFHHI